MDRLEAEKRLFAIFGIEHFYDEQWSAIERIMRGERVLMIERTGFGKSLCYQFPATQFTGLTVIFSPLIALMRDQVKSLNSRGIAAGYINSEQTVEENRASIDRALRGNLKILYIAPERQENQEWIEATRQMNLSMIVIDEAHTISTWGHDFRPAFCRIIDLVQLLPKHLPILATTATATKRVQQDIERQIGGNLTTIRGSLVRKNFRMCVIRVKSEDEKMIWLAENLPKFPGTGLIYTGTRVNTEIYSRWLTHVGISATDYNAGFDGETRKEIEQGLMENRWKCIVSTNALGMGIDKPDIRFVIHTQIPASPIHYYQEIGRAGRDGKTTFIVLFYNEAIERDEIAADYRLPLAFIESARPSKKTYEKVIELLKEEPLSISQLVQRANIKTNQARIIKADLIDQGIIKEVKYGDKKMYEYQYDAPELDATQFEMLRQAKIKDLDAMVGYVYTSKPRMKYLCQFLDSDDEIEYINCDNTTLNPPRDTNNPILIRQLDEFREMFFPYLDLSESTTKPRSGFKVRVRRPDMIEVTTKDGEIHTYKGRINLDDFSIDARPIVNKVWERHQKNASRIVDGCAASYYGVSNIGTTIHRCKYEGGGDFPDYLLSKTLSMYGKKFRDIEVDLVLYVPPTVSGDLVRNFAEKFAAVIGVPVSHSLVKIKQTKEQKIFQNTYSKRANVSEAFDIDKSIVADKRIVLIDDIYDSGATLREIGKLLTLRGAKYIIPIVIAKTVGGTL